jgi:DNA-binding CsgD family transcriptional regulator
VRFPVPATNEPGVEHPSAVRACSVPETTRWVLCCGRHEYVLTASVIVGRGVDADIQVDDERVSRQHARLRWVAGAFELEDLGSTNGTRVNGEQVAAPVRLRLGDDVGLGDSVLRLTVVAELRCERVTQPAASDSTPGTNSLGTISLDALTPRERIIFPLLARGLSQRQIAAECSVTVKTVETYRTRISHKLGLHSRADLIRFALETGVLRPMAGN